MQRLELEVLELRAEVRRLSDALFIAEAQLQRPAMDPMHPSLRTVRDE
jgi:hypothetical protein